MKQLLDKIKKQFTETTHLPLELQFNGNDQVKIQLKWDKKKFLFKGLFVPDITPTNLSAVMARLQQLPKPSFIITKYVNPLMADRLKNFNIFFLDAAGNVFLKVSPLFLYIKGNRSAQDIPNIATHRIWRSAGLQIIFTLLSNPGIENKSYRFIAQNAGVALGTVATIMQKLKETGYLIETGKKGKKLYRKKDLFERWVMLYPDFLRHKLILGIFRPEDETWWHRIDLKGYDAKWSGEAAAWKLTNYLKPQKFVIYVNQIPERLLIDFKMKKDTKGSVEILRKFWNFSDNTELVPPILIYGDLMATGDPRNIEVGKIIYEQKIAKLIGES